MEIQDLQKVRFQKTTNLLWEEGLLKLFEVALVWLKAVGENLHLIGKENQALEAWVDRMIKDFEDLYDHFEERKGWKRLTQQDYKAIKRDLNRLKYISMNNLKENILAIAQTMYKFPLNFSYPDL